MPESITIIVPTETIIFSTEGMQIEVEVEPYHTPKDIIDLVISQLKLSKLWSLWALTLKGETITSDDGRTLGEIGVKNGDVLRLVRVLPPLEYLGDGMSKDTAIFFTKAKTELEHIALQYEFLRQHGIKSIMRGSRIEEGYIFDVHITEKGELWFKVPI